jgi:hypothetical protein
VYVDVAQTQVRPLDAQAASEGGEPFGGQVAGGGQDEVWFAGVGWLRCGQRAMPWRSSSSRVSRGCWGVGCLPAMTRVQRSSLRREKVRAATVRARSTAGMPCGKLRLVAASATWVLAAMQPRGGSSAVGWRGVVVRAGSSGGRGRPSGVSRRPGR